MFCGNHLLNFYQNSAFSKFIIRNAVSIQIESNWKNKWKINMKMRGTVVRKSACICVEMIEEEQSIIQHELFVSQHWRGGSHCFLNMLAQLIRPADSIIINGIASFHKSIVIKCPNLFIKSIKSFIQSNHLKPLANKTDIYWINPLIFLICLFIYDVNKKKLLKLNKKITLQMLIIMISAFGLFLHRDLSLSS